MTVRLVPLDAIAERADPALALARVTANQEISAGVWRLTLDAPSVARSSRPGQFAMLTVARRDQASPVLPRPMALYGWDAAAGTIDVVYRVVGTGTRLLTTWRSGEVMTCVGPLGRAFGLAPSTRRILLLGRGIGVCSLSALAEEARRRDVEVDAVVSAREPQALIGRADFVRFGVASLTEVTDEDGSSEVGRLRPRLEGIGSRGRPWDQVFVCGSQRLLRLAAELGHKVGAEIEVSIEARMACGLGFCHGCATGNVGAADESALVCVDGPVFRCLVEA